MYNIVTSAIDMDEYNDIYNAKIENVKTGKYYQSLIHLPICLIFNTILTHVILV